MSEAVCFVDDDPEEVRRFRRLLASRFLVGAGTSLAAALEDLRAQGCERLDVFALDLYFPDGDPNTEDERSELARAWGRFLEAKAELTAVLERLRQSPEGGLALARRVGGEFRGVPERAGWPTAEACDAALSRELPKVVQGLERALARRGCVTSA